MRFFFSPILFFMALWAAVFPLHAAVIDEVAAVVGNEPIWTSDIEQELMQQKAQGRAESFELRCEIFENLLVQKLLLAQARLDSLKVNEMGVKQGVDERLRYFTAQLGGAQEVERHFGKSMAQIRSDLTDYMRDLSLTQQMQHSISSKVPPTPRDARQYYQSMPPDSFPMLPQQYIIQQIVRYPPSGKQAKFDVREQLIELRERILKGEKFSALAVLYSEDPGSAKRGGELGMRSREEYVKPFAEAAWNLKPNQVSQIVETEFGFHIIQLIEKQGEMANLRHILLKPKFSAQTQQQAARLLDSIAALIAADSITFERAAMFYSEDKETRMGGGFVINPANQTNRFEKDQLQPADYFEMQKLKLGQVSHSFASKDLRGSDIFKILRVKQIIPAHRADWEQDYGLIYDITAHHHQQKLLEEWIDKAIARTIIKISPAMRACTLKRHWGF
jgi:peptidyl-prolyl cis-trans isomerase SurA